jgi:hypothetical protein
MIDSVVHTSYLFTMGRRWLYRLDMLAIFRIRLLIAFGESNN